MAVVQISKIQIRRGLQEDLPQLASAELAWSIDERRLYIGNGTLAEGAPTLGVTEVLTAQSIFTELNLIQILQGNVANLEANVTTIQSEITSLQANAAVQTITLLNNMTSANIAIVTAPTLVTYTIARNANLRMGTLSSATAGLVTSSEDDYTETADIGVSFGFTGNMFQYTTTNITGPGNVATMNFHVTTF
jgi:hypothetical protein